MIALLGFRAHVTQVAHEVRGELRSDDQARMRSRRSGLRYAVAMNGGKAYYLVRMAAERGTCSRYARRGVFDQMVGAASIPY